MIDHTVSYSNKWLLRIYLVVFLSSLIMFVCTERYEIFVTPFILLYVVALFVNWKFTYWVLLFCIPLSFEYALPGGGLSVSLPDEPMMWGFLLLLPVLFAFRPGIIYKWWLQDPVVIIVLLQLAWLIVAVLYSKVLFFSVKFLFAKIWYLVCFFLFPVWVFRTKKDIRKGFYILAASILSTVIVIICRQAGNHFSFIMVNHAIGMLYNNHVEYSTVVSMFLPLMFIGYQLCPSEKRWAKFFLAAFTLLFLAAIFFSYARAAMLAVMFSIVIALCIRFRIVNLVMPCIYGCIALGMIFLVQNENYINLRPNYEHTYMHHDFKRHILATFKGQDMSSMERIYRWIAAVRMSRDRPIVGYGPHSFYYYYKPYTINMFKTYVSKNSEHSTTHNYFLYMLVEQGWPAMVLYALLLIIVFAHAQRTYVMAQDRFYKLTTLGLAMTFAASFVNNFFSELIETHKVGALFYLSMALLVIIRKKVVQVKSNPGIVV